MLALLLTVYNFGQPTLSSLNLIFLTGRMINFISWGSYVYVVSMCNQILIKTPVVPQNRQAEPKVETKESIFNDRRKHERPVISLGIYYKAAKLTLPSSLPQPLPTSPLLHL